MAVTININELTLCHKGDVIGYVKATLPDVCKATPSSTPSPYPNIAYATTLAKGTKTVKVDGGNMAGIKGSEFSSSVGDEPGIAGGEKSRTNMAEATWLSYSMNVFFEGKNVCRRTDKMLMNHVNTACMAGYYTIRLILAGAFIERMIICDAICYCDKNPVHKTYELRDKCAGDYINAHNYTMTMKTKQAYWVGNDKQLTIPYELKPSEVLPEKGTKIIPDVTILINPNKPATRDNIKAIVEIKFTDKPIKYKGIQDLDQIEIHQRIAGDKAPAVKLDPEECDCGQKDKNAKVLEATKAMSSGKDKKEEVSNIVNLVSPEKEELEIAAAVAQALRSTVSVGMNLGTLAKGLSGVGLVYESIAGIIGFIVDIELKQSGLLPPEA